VLAAVGAVAVGAIFLLPRDDGLDWIRKYGGIESRTRVGKDERVRFTFRKMPAEIPVLLRKVGVRRANGLDKEQPHSDWSYVWKENYVEASRWKKPTLVDRLVRMIRLDEPNPPK